MSPVFAPEPPGNLRIPPDRIGLYGTVFALIGAAMVVLQWIVTHKSADWGVFQSAAHIVGTPALLAYRQMNPFVYMPAFAWAYVPFASLPEVAGAMVNAAFTLCMSIVAGYLGMRIYRIPLSLSLLLVFAWCPVWSVIVLGQNAGIGLLLAMLAIFGVVEGSPWIEGIAIAGLLYKPQFALPFIALAIVLRRWKSVGIVALGSLGWYGTSVVATGGDWEWPARWIRVVRDYAPLDATHNAPFALGLPTLLYRFGIPESIAVAAGLVVLLVGIFKLLKRPALEAWSMMPLIGLAASPHALEYDAVLALPAIFWVVTCVSEPSRTRIIAIAYVLAPFWLLSSVLHFDTLMLLILGGTLAYYFCKPSAPMEAA